MHVSDGDINQRSAIYTPGCTARTLLIAGIQHRCACTLHNAFAGCERTWWCFTTQIHLL